MLFIICALACEAKPLISHFHLQQIETSSPFPIFMSSSIGLIITGVGKIQTAAAMGYLQSFTGNQMHAAWLNVGIAGHASWPLGTAVLAHQIIDQTSGRSFYPTFVVDRPVKTAVVWSVDQPEMQYEAEGVYEMEAAAFWSIASRFTTAELIHCYKIISDNRESHSTYLTKNQVEELVEKELHHIDSFGRSLQTLSQSLIQLELATEEIEPFLTQWHFTATQQFQLKRLLQRWKACTKQPLRILWDADLLAQSKAAHVLQNLLKRLQELPYHLSP